MKQKTFKSWLATALFVFSVSVAESSDSSASAAVPVMEPTKFFTSLRESWHDCSTRCNCVGCPSCLGVTIYQFEANDKSAPPIYWCRPGLEDSQDDLHIGKVVYKALLRDKLPKAVRAAFPRSFKKLPGMIPHHITRRSTDSDHVSQAVMMQDQSQPEPPQFDPLDPAKSQFGQATHQVTVPNLAVKPGTSQGTENRQAALLRMPVSAAEVAKVTGSAPDPSLLTNSGLRQGGTSEENNVTNPDQQGGQNQTDQLQPTQPTTQGQSLQPTGFNQQNQNVPQQGSNQTMVSQGTDQQQSVPSSASAVDQPPQPSIDQLLQQRVQQQQNQLEQQKAHVEQQLANEFVTVQQQAQNLRNQVLQQHQNLQQLQQQESLLQQQNFQQQNNAVLQQQALQQQNNAQQQQNLQQQQQNLNQQTQLQQGQALRTETQQQNVTSLPETSISPPGQQLPTQVPPQVASTQQTAAPDQVSTVSQTQDITTSAPPDRFPTEQQSSNNASDATSGSVSGSAFSTSPSGVRVSGFVSSSNESSPAVEMPLEVANTSSSGADASSAPVLSNVTLTTSDGNVTIDIQSAGTPNSSSTSVPAVPQLPALPTSDLTASNGTTSTSSAASTPPASGETSGAAVITRPTDQDSMTIVVVAPSKVLTLVQGKNIAVEVMNEPIQNCSQDSTQPDQVSNQKRIELLKSAITALQFTLSKLEQERPLESVQVLLTSRCQGANGTSTQMAGEPASIKITPNPQLPPGQVRIDVQTTAEDQQQQQQPMTNFEAGPCATMDIERYKTEMSTAVYAMYQNEPTLFVFINNARCVGVFRQSKEKSIVPAETLFPEFPWKDNFFKASVYYNDVLYVFDASTPQRVWTFQFDPQRNNFRVTSEGVVSLEEFARSGCLIPNLPPSFKVHAAGQATTTEPSCVLFDEHRNPVTTPTPEARGLATAVSKVADQQFLQSVKALFAWHNEQSPSNQYVFGSNDELYKVFRGTRGGSSWRTSSHVLVPYENYPY